MKNILQIFLFTFFTILLGYAQNPNYGGGGGRPNFDPNFKGFLVGKVIDSETKQGLEYATISVFRVKDSTLVGGGITNPEGNFKIETPPGKFYAKVDFISYVSVKKENILIIPDSPTADLGTIELAQNTTLLNSVVIEGERELVEMSLDKRIFNVSKDMSNIGGSAADVLNNVPSVSVDTDGNVSLRGNTNVRILVDGKQSGLVGISSTDALRKLSGSMIESIEVVTNPSVRYDAEGMAGIINIVLKKDKKQGLNGSVDAQVAAPAIFGTSVNLNFRKEKINIFTNAGINYRERIARGLSTQNFFLADTSFSTERTRRNVRSGLSGNVRLGIEYFINSNTTLSGYALYRDDSEVQYSTLNYFDYNNLGDLTRSTQRYTLDNSTSPNLEYAVNFKKNFEKKKGSFWTMDAQYRTSKENGSSTASDVVKFNALNNNVTDLYQRWTENRGEMNLVLQTDLVYKINKDVKVEGGAKSSTRTIGNDYNIEEQVNETTWTQLPLSNNFNYYEQINAVYGLLGVQQGKLSYQLGLRVEDSHIGTELVNTNSKTTKTYINAFPSAHFTYKLTDTKSIQWSYSKRITRPHFHSLNPFFTYSDPRNIRAGNPDLNPEYTNAVEGGYLVNWKKSSLFSSAYYRYTTDVVQRLSTVDSLGVTLSQPVNMAFSHSYGFEFNVNKDLFDWWKVFGNFNFYRQTVDGTNLDNSLKSDTYTWSARVNSRTTLHKGLDMQTTFDYRAPERSPQGIRKAFYSLNVGFSKDVMKSKGTLTLNVRDVFNSRKFRFDAEGINFTSTNQFQWMTRQVVLDFSYRINQNKRQGGNRSGGGMDGGGMDGGF